MPSTPDAAPRHDWQIGVAFARRLEAALQRTGPTLFPYTTPESIWNEHRESTRGRDLDITGLSYALLDAAPRQWPAPADTGHNPDSAGAGTARLYTDGRFATPDGRARFVSVAYQPVAERREAHYPFSLNTGRLRDQWHGMSRTGTLGRLFGHVREPALQMHPQDMVRKQLNDGDLVHLRSRRGAIVVPVQGQAEQALNQVFLAMHWGGEFLGGAGPDGARLAGVNALTTPAFCPDSRQPEFKHAAVRIDKADLPWTLRAMAWLPADRVLTVRGQLQALMDSFAFAACTLFTSGTGAPEPQGIMFRAAHPEPVPPALLERIESLLDLQRPDAPQYRYQDAKRGQRRCMRLQAQGDDTLLQGFLLAGDTRAHPWLGNLLQEALPVQNYGRALLLSVSEPPLPVASQGRVVCTCFGVRDLAITGHLQQCHGTGAGRLADLQRTLHCGTNCGSCVPELQRLVRQTPALTPPLPLDNAALTA